MALRDLLLTWNPWLLAGSRGPDLIRQRLPPLLPRAARPPLTSDRATLVVGPRQVGKSTLLLASALERSDLPLVLINAEEPAFADLCRSPGEFVHWLETDVVDRPSLLLFEEIQHIDRAPLSSSPWSTCAPVTRSRRREARPLTSTPARGSRSPGAPIGSGCCRSRSPKRRRTWPT